ncbi:MAG: T9SS type A sorting domain-containing protein [Vicingaceae bacterium]|nr:T9SS type A sorting domain-containing protein [Vicingaceae bacterium]
MNKANYNYLLIFCFCVFFLTTAKAQPTIEWEKSYGGSGFEFLYSMQKTADGGYILAGSSVSNDGDLTNNQGAGDYWIVKIDSIGTLEWQKSYGGSEHDEAYSVQQTTDGGYIVAGMSNSNDGDINDHNGSVTVSDCWVLRLDNLGNIIWKKSLGGSGSDKAYAIQQTTDGGFIMSGLSSSNDGDVSVYLGGFWDYWVVKLDAFGNIQWEKSLGGNGNDAAFSVYQSNDGGYIIAGGSNSTNGHITNNKGGFDYWVVKLDNLGNIQWDKSYGGSGGDFAYSIKQTNDGGFIIYGDRGSLDGDLVNCNGTNSTWVVKIDNFGNIEWGSCLNINIGGGSFPLIRSNDGVYLSNDGGYLFVSHLSGSYWVGKLSGSGGLLWSKTLGGSNFDESKAIIQNSDGSYLVAGHTNSSDGDVSLNKGMTDFWVVKLSAVVSIDEIENTPLTTIFPNPTNGIFTISSTEGINEVEVFNTLGQAVYNKKITSNSTTINLTSFPKGLYLVQLKTNTNIITKKIVYE